jgi:predicted  nucleic acid-binding Zn-ribbon protein
MKIEASADQIRALLSLASLDAEGEALQCGLPPLALERCRALVAAGRRPPIVTIERGACSGCHLRLPAMVEAKATHCLALYSCPHCRRLLYTRALLR